MFVQPGRVAVAGGAVETAVKRMEIVPNLGLPLAGKLRIYQHTVLPSPLPGIVKYAKLVTHILQRAMT